MSEVAQSKDETALGELAERYQNKDKVVALANDDQEAFVNFVDTLKTHDGKPAYEDWTLNTDQKVFTGLALVRSESGVNRLIAIASEDAAFADPVVRKAIYKMYVNRVVNSAADDEANPASFITIAGCFKVKFDLDAFKSIQRAMTKYLRDTVGLRGMTNSALRNSFASEAFAKTQFPRMPGKAWEKIISIAQAMAEKAGHNTSIFDHWKATRLVQSADTSEIKFDFDHAEDEVEEIAEALEEKKEAKEAAK